MALGGPVSERVFFLVLELNEKLHLPKFRFMVSQGASCGINADVSANALTVGVRAAMRVNEYKSPILNHTIRVCSLCNSF